MCASTISRSCVVSPRPTKDTLFRSQEQQIRRTCSAKLLPLPLLRHVRCSRILSLIQRRVWPMSIFLQESGIEEMTQSAKSPNLAWCCTSREFFLDCFFCMRAHKRESLRGQKIPFFLRHVSGLPFSCYGILNGIDWTWWVHFNGGHNLRWAASTCWPRFRPPHAEETIGAQRLAGVRLAGESFVLENKNSFF